MSKEMCKKVRGSARKGRNFMTKNYKREYRFRRYQALDDALNIFFLLYDNKAWMTVNDIIDAMEWEPETHAVNKRVRRICESLRRVGRVEISQTHSYKPMFIRSLL